MKATQEPKYCIVDENGNELPNARIANRATMQPIPDSEPIMIFRAKDRNAAPAIANYITRCENQEHMDNCRGRLEQFHAFQIDNQDICKEPD